MNMSRWSPYRKPLSDFLRLRYTQDMIKQSLTLAICFLLLNPSWGSPTLIATIAQVRNHVITSRELAIHQELDKVLGTRSDKAKAGQPLELLIREWLLFYEAKIFYNNSVPSSEIESELKKAVSGLKIKNSWQKLAISQEEVREKIMRRLEADRLFLFKKKASVLPIPLSELEAEYTQNKVQYGGASFGEVREKIRKLKAEENLNQRLEQWFQVLEKKYSVQRFAKFAPPVQ